MNYKSPDWCAQCEHELIFSNENLPFKLFPFEGKDGNYRRSGHWHRSVEIFLVQEGEYASFSQGNREDGVELVHRLSALYEVYQKQEYAVREMMHTRHSLQEIAAHNGFPDSRAFSKAFRSRYGCLPSAYRRENEIH